MVQSPDPADLETRLERIERQLDIEGETRPPRSFHPFWPLGTGIAAIALGYFSVGIPGHYYQALFSILLLLLLYHRGSLQATRGHWKWPQIAVNFILLSLLFQFLIGGGVIHPFDWIKLPALAKAPPSGDQSWYSAVVPDYTVQWQSIPKLAEWSIDITRIQTFLLLAVLAGALFRFEPFTSFTALALLILSLPAYLRFNWDWVVPFLIAGSVSLYLQARDPVRKR